MKARVLLVEDDPDLARGVRFNLEHDGYAVIEASTAKAARASIAEATTGAIDLVLLDLNLPDGDGLDLLREWRAAKIATPILCLTARAQETDVVMGLGLGADDYLKKPFGLAELLARIGALLRRRTVVAADPSTAESRLRLGEVVVDRAAHRVIRGKRSEPLTPIEMQLLDYLLAANGKAVDRALLLKDLWGVDRAATTRTLDNHVARLRKKLERDASDPRFLITVHGIGYRLALDTTPGPPRDA